MKYDITKNIEINTEYYSALTEVTVLLGYTIALFIVAINVISGVL